MAFSSQEQHPNKHSSRTGSPLPRAEQNAETPFLIATCPLSNRDKKRRLNPSFQTKAPKKHFPPNTTTFYFKLVPYPRNQNLTRYNHKKYRIPKSWYTEKKIRSQKNDMPDEKTENCSDKPIKGNKDSEIVTD